MNEPKRPVGLWDHDSRNKRARAAASRRGKTTKPTEPGACFSVTQSTDWPTTPTLLQQLRAQIDKHRRAQLGLTTSRHSR